MSSFLSAAWRRSLLPACSRLIQTFQPNKIPQGVLLGRKISFLPSTDYLVSIFSKRSFSLIKSEDDFSNQIKTERFIELVFTLAYEEQSKVLINLFLNTLSKKSFTQSTSPSKTRQIVNISALKSLEEKQRAIAQFVENGGEINRKNCKGKSLLFEIFFDPCHEEHIAELIQCLTHYGFIIDYHEFGKIFSNYDFLEQLIVSDTTVDEKLLKGLFLVKVKAFLPPPSIRNYHTTEEKKQAINIFIALGGNVNNLTLEGSYLLYDVLNLNEGIQETLELMQLLLNRHLDEPLRINLDCEKYHLGSPIFEAAGTNQSVEWKTAVIRCLLNTFYPSMQKKYSQNEYEEWILKTIESTMFKIK